MSSVGNSSNSSSVPSFTRLRVQDELKQIADRTQISDEHLEDLRDELIPNQTPLPVQKQIVETIATTRERAAGHRYISIDILQNTIKDLEIEISHLLQESTQAQSELKKRREKLRLSLIELLHLKKLIEKIENEISQLTCEYQTALLDFHQKRQEILTDPNLSEDEKKLLLGNLETEIHDLQKIYASKLGDMQKEREKLKDEARMDTELLKATLNDLHQQHLDVITQLEKSKVGARSSEIKRINKEIKRINEEYEYNVKLLNDTANSKRYSFDDHGRFYLNENGEKIYKRDSYSLEYKIESDGTQIKVKDGFEIMTNDIGEYYIDKFGRNIYVKYNFNEAFQYDEEENERKSSFDFSETVSEIQQLTSQEFRCQEALEYIKSTVGRPLRHGLAQMIMLNPEDPIDFLANFLLHYRSNEIKFEKERIEIENLT
uniref:CSON001331 protein n=1 Tax=Culicoides sonorensis TaxID=179676 RepID=A0A336LIT6_CULSO